MVILFSKVLEDESLKANDSQIFPLVQKKDLINLEEEDEENLVEKKNCC